MLWFTSDWHIGHDKPFLYEPRGFSNIYDHDTTLLENCNSLVQPDDELWILGDLALGDIKEWNRIYCKLNCRHVHFLVGNHESDPKMDIFEDNYQFIYEGYACVIKYSKNKTFYLSHYPTITDRKEYTHKHRTVNLYGHTHQTTNFFNDNPYMYHVGVNSHNLYPVSIEEIIKDIERKVINNEI